MKIDLASLRIVAGRMPIDLKRGLFAQWRARHGLSLADAAKALGMTSRTMSAYGSGSRPVPRYIALACKGWEAERESKR